jgi:hypothetical protein
VSAITNHLVNATPATLLPAASRSASANGTGIDMSLYEGNAIVIVELTNVSGTSPTADFKLQECDTVGGTYTDLGAAGSLVPAAAATQVGAASSLQKLAIEVQATKKFVRGVLTLAGTSPVYTCSAYVLGVKKY